MKTQLSQVTRITLRTIVALLLALTPSFASERGVPAVIDDTDGFTNIRAAASKGSRVLGRVTEGEQFTVFPSESSWWRLETGAGLSGFIHRSCVRMIDSPEKASSRAAPAAAGDGDAFDLVPGSSARVHEPSSATETYLRELERLNTVYFLGCTYTPIYGDFRLLRDHLTALLALEAKHGNGVPESVRACVKLAIAQDVVYGELVKARSNRVDHAWDDVCDSARAAIKDYSAGREGDTFSRQLFASAMRMAAAQMAIDEFAASKARTRPHEQWHAALKGIEAGPGSLLSLYQEHPGLLDPTWQFADRGQAGDRFFAPTFNSRSGVPFKLATPQRVGDLARGPIRVEIPRHRGRITAAVSFSIPPGGQPRMRLVCRAGHLAASLYSPGNYANDNVVWAARGFEDPSTHGAVTADFRAGNRSLEGRSAIVHLPMHGAGEDSLAEGTVYIYLGDASSEQQENTTQRTVLAR